MLVRLGRSRGASCCSRAWWQGESINGKLRFCAIDVLQARRRRVRARGNGSKLAKVVKCVDAAWSIQLSDHQNTKINRIILEQACWI